MKPTPAPDTARVYPLGRAPETVNRSPDDIAGFRSYYEAGCCTEPVGTALNQSLLESLKARRNSRVCKETRQIASQQ